MRVFVTGASGFIGGAVAAALARAGHKVFGLVRTPAKAGRVARAEVRPIVGDMSEPGPWIDLAAGCEVVVHAAAEYSERLGALDRSTVTTVLERARASGLPRTFVYTSGAWVVGPTGDAPADEAAPLPEALPPALAGRAQTERLVLEANAGALRTLVVRPGCVFGGAGSLTALWFESATREKAAMVIGDGQQRWAMVHIDDLADLYVRAVQSPFGGELFQAADRSRFTVLECAKAASRASGAGGAVRHVPVGEAEKTLGFLAHGMALDQHLDASKAERLLGWRPVQRGFPDAVERYHLAWEAARGA
jgi:nucleoside-diphosphate-sugar epimerase